MKPQVGDKMILRQWRRKSGHWDGNGAMARFVEGEPELIKREGIVTKVGREYVYIEYTANDRYPSPSVLRERIDRIGHVSTLITRDSTHYTVVTPEQDAVYDEAVEAQERVRKIDYWRLSVDDVIALDQFYRERIPRYDR